MNMVRLIFLFVVLMFATDGYACEKEHGFIDQESLDRIKEMIVLHVGADTEIAAIKLLSGDTTLVSDIIVHYFKPGEDKIASKGIVLESGETFESNFAGLVPLPGNGCKIQDVDFSMISSNIEEAIGLIEQKGLFAKKGTEFQCVSSYQINCSKEPLYVSHEYEIESKDFLLETRQGSTEEAQMIIEFRAQSDGRVYIFSSSTVW
ncbi:MAG: hypothetical protein LBV72_13630 [Tannerella sp.]|jgi:hypothetical protein|nr:hypothetical protein [Tannerella sp.]